MTKTPREIELETALRALLDWCRDNTSPRDANSPHDLLVAASELLASTEAGQ